MIRNPIWIINYLHKMSSERMKFYSIFTILYLAALIFHSMMDTGIKLHSGIFILFNFTQLDYI